MAPSSALRLAAADRNKLAAILGLLSSDKPGEVAAAAAAATRFVRSRDIQWLDLLTPALPEPEPPPSPASFDIFHDWPTRWRAGVYLCQKAPQTGLSPFERQFVANLSRYKNKPSNPQLDILATIVGNVIAAGGAAP